MKPAGMIVDPLLARVREQLGDRAVREQAMFGGVCFMLNGNMTLGVQKGELLVRVGGQANEAALARPHARQMEMGAGRMAIGYVKVAPEGARRDRDLAGWVDLALAFNATLPPKAAKKPKAATGAVRTPKKPAPAARRARAGGAR